MVARQAVQVVDDGRAERRVVDGFALGSRVERGDVGGVVPAVRLGGELGGLVLDSVNAVPEALTRSGYTWHDADVRAVLAEGLSPSR